MGYLVRNTFAAVLMAAASCLCAQNEAGWGVVPASRLPKRNFHEIEELHTDLCLDTMAWQTVPDGLQAAFGSTSSSYARREVPSSGLSSEARSVVWKGERAYFQVLVWSREKTEQIRLIPSGFTDGSGNTLDSLQTRCQMVRYVLSNYPYGGIAPDCGTPVYEDGFMMPDRLEPFDRFDLDSCTARPIWVSIDVPRTAEAGIFHGRIEVRSKGGASQFLPVELDVQDQILPPPAEWGYRLDLWQNPWAVAWYNNAEPWSEEHILLLKKHLRLYADAGGTYITTYCVHSPWSDNSYMNEGSMIEWTRNADGSWSFDYSVFDRYVELAQECGITKAITVYTPLPWGNRHRYKDAATGDYVEQIWPPESDGFKNVWNAFLTDLKNHLKAKGWFDRTYIGINENGFEETLAAARFVKENDASWKTTYAGGWNRDLEGYFDDFCSVYGSEPEAGEIAERARKGRTSTYYVCCNPPEPNDFVFSPPEQGRWLGWYALSRGYDGFLRWAYDAWPEDVKRDARHVIWPAGDCFLVYPGARSSIRLEKLREGISDCVKARILLSRASSSKDKAAGRLVTRMREILAQIAAEKDFSESHINGCLSEADSIVDRLSVILR